MSGEASDPIVIVGMACRLPGATNCNEFEQLLFEGRSAIQEMPQERFDRQLYFDERKGRHGKTYTQLAGCVPDRRTDSATSHIAVPGERSFDPAHLHFADVAAEAWQNAELTVGDTRWAETGVFVGHSGGTQNGGALGLATQIEEALQFLNDIPQFRQYDRQIQQRIIANVTSQIRDDRPQRKPNEGPYYNAYYAAAVAAKALELAGPRIVVDGACASSLIALNHAIMALRAGRIQAAVVGGATFNSVDNLILFSHSQACSDRGSQPFDNDASGLISCEGYVALVVTTQSKASEAGLPVRAIVTGVGISSDGRGRSLWAPLPEGQKLALHRAYEGRPLLDIDYLECHATSTQLGDATELESVSAVVNESQRPQHLPVVLGSVKSNIGHALESAGLIGLVKVILSMRRHELPPSINIKTLNQQFDWSGREVRVVQHVEPWPNSGDRLRAGISAFGIGGLNAHINIEAPTTQSTTPSENIARRTNFDEPIAIIGRGVVLPGALDLDGFSSLLETQRSVIRDAPEERWQNQTGVTENTAPTAFSSPTTRGGYITDFEFDGEAYRIPPRQVSQANPVQMMLLDAVTQALNDSNDGEWIFDQQRVGVVIGTIFGCEFGNQLQLGLRLPEICQLVAEELQAEGKDADVEYIEKAFRDIVLKQRPALLDETGSFTASTLASRVAKTFDLMGGACAIDADDASGLAALAIAVDQLRSGQVDAMVCGTAHRAMDLSAFEDLHLSGRLVQSGRIEDIPDDCSQILPGEGVTTLLLCRLSDAKRLGVNILGTIGTVTQHTRPETPTQTHSSEDATLVRQIGYLAGSHSLVRLVRETLRWQNSDQISGVSDVTLKSRTVDGFSVVIDVSPPEVRLVASQTISEPATPQSTVQMPTSFTTASTLPIIHIGGKSSQQILDQIESGLRQPEELLRRNLAGFAASDQYRVAFVAASPATITDQLTAIRTAWRDGSRCCVLERAAAVLWQQPSETSRIAWTFPGQGSQYAGSPAVLNESSVAADTFAELDSILKRMGLPPLQSEFTQPSGQLGRDVWLTQLWVLGVGVALSRSLAARGHRADFMLGHSFGEYVSSVAAGVMPLDQAVRFVKHRTDAVAMSGARGVLLSIKGSLSEVDSVLRQSGLPLTITHYNSPTQTVVAGQKEAVEQFRLALSDAQLASVVVSVPAPFHTQLLSDAQQTLHRLVDSESLRPPSNGFISATSAAFLAEPNDVRQSLVEQLTQPVLYQPAVQRLLDVGCRMLLEVGPNDVLTRLNRSIVGDSALCLSLDVPGQSYTQRTALVDAAMACVRTTPATRHGAYSVQQSGGLTSKPSEVVDVRRSRRSTQDRKPNQEHTAGIAAKLIVNERIAEPIAIAPPATVSVAHSIEESTVGKFLLDLVVELTGYSRSVLEFDADLEADLGLDSIKKAQIIGEFAEWADCDVNATELRLGELRTLGDIVALISPKAVPQHPIPTFNTADTEPAPAASSNATAEESRFHPNSIGNLLIDFVVAQTGYSRKVVDLDADLEADLGLDSIKIAQIIGELQEQLGLHSIRAEDLSLSEFRTLRRIQDFLIAALEAQNGTSTEVHTDSVARTSPAPLKQSSVRTPISSPESNHIEASTSLIGNDPVDEVPESWREMFRSRNGLADLQTAWNRGHALGSQHRSEIQATLRLLVDTSPQQLQTNPEWNDLTEQEMRGLAKGAGVAFESVRFASSVLHHDDNTATGNGLGGVIPGHAAYTPEPTQPNESPTRTHRFALRVVDAPRRLGMPSLPHLSGPAIILGKSTLATTLEKTITDLGHAVHVLNDVTNVEEASSRFIDITKQGLPLHLFLLTAHDDDAMTQLDARHWKQRRVPAIQIPFRICQLWMQAVIEAGRMEDATVVTASQLGGDFGFSGQHVASPEFTGALVKAMLIECWMNDFRTTPMKVVDIPPNTTAQAAVQGMLNELAVPSYDAETVVTGGDRRSVEAVPQPLNTNPGNREYQPRPITSGGTWVVSGGGRGITALTAMALAEKHNLTLHLVGTAPVPNVADSIRQAALSDRSALRRQVMAEASGGDNPVEVWRNTEKAIEIDVTLQECVRRGILATYHSCDVADANAVEAILTMIRRDSGPIRGVLHGAGAGQDSRFDRKRPDKVEKCLQAKIDGCLSLINATQADPLEWFVAYGSISGRFGANGHTDYSLANDMMAKIIDRYRSERPDVSSLTFHWHAWGDVGMATKPEARLALEMIDMDFMPAVEGVKHFLQEFEHGGNEPEVLITDHSYYRKFFPAERVAEQSDSTTLLPMLGRAVTAQRSLSQPWAVTLDPVGDRFLSQHRVGGKPTLPFVVAIELLAEAARCTAGQNCVIECKDIVAAHALKFATDEPIAVQLTVSEADDHWFECRLSADVRRRDGRLVEADRVYFRGQFQPADQYKSGTKTLLETAGLKWQPIEYLNRDADIYHGPELQCLRSIAIDGDLAWGRIAASAPVQLFGADRTQGWTVPCAPMDACLYACAVAGWQKFAKASLPVRFGKIQFGRQPDPGEPCVVSIKVLRHNDKGMTCSFRLQGLNGDTLLRVTNYRMAWLAL